MKFAAQLITYVVFGLSAFHVIANTEVVPQVNKTLFGDTGVISQVDKTYFPDYSKSWDNIKGSPIDLFILNFALTLEHLEAEFYRSGLSRFRLTHLKSAGLGRNEAIQLRKIFEHEKTHVTVLTDVIENIFGKGKAAPPCKYNFGFNDVKSFIDLAAVLERVGVSAYIGAIRFIVDFELRIAGASIATVEARHASFLNLLNHRDTSEGAFDTPLGIRTIFSLASKFIVQCPFTFPPELTAFPSLGLFPSRARVNDVITIAIKVNYDTSRYSDLRCAFVFGLTQIRVSLSIDQGWESSKGYSYGNDDRNFIFPSLSAVPRAFCKIPKILAFNQVVVFIVSQDRDIVLIEENRGDNVVVAGPAFLDLY